MTYNKLSDPNVPKGLSEEWQRSFSAAAVDLTRRLHECSVELDPFEHLIVDQIFPTDIYKYMIELAIDDFDLRTLSDLGRTSPGTYANRSVIDLSGNLSMLPRPQQVFWTMAYQFTRNVIAPALLHKFSNTILKRFSVMPNMHLDMLYVRDRKGYKLTPHTDSPRKICTFLVYLAEDSSQGPGTSFYRPNDTGFRCEGGPHHPRELFEITKTLPYTPNLMCAFVKTDRSFHGVEPIVLDTIRNLLICDVQKY